MLVSGRVPEDPKNIHIWVTRDMWSFQGFLWSTMMFFGLTQCSLRMFLCHIFSGSDMLWIFPGCFNFSSYISSCLKSTISDRSSLNVESGNPENQMRHASRCLAGWMQYKLRGFLGLKKLRSTSEFQYVCVLGCGLSVDLISCLETKDIPRIKTIKSVVDVSCSP